jgi:hypothetical protein
MSVSLEKILEQYYVPAGNFDAPPVRDGLLADLTRHQREQRGYQNIQIALIVVLALMAVAALAFDLVQAENRRHLILAGAGVSIPTLLALLRRTIAERSRTDLFIILVKNSNEKEALALLRTYIDSKK